MPTITIYLTNELYDKVKNAPSKTVRAALEHYFTDKADEVAETSEHPQLPDREPSKSKATATSE